LDPVSDVEALSERPKLSLSRATPENLDVHIGKGGYGLEEYIETLHRVKARNRPDNRGARFRVV
jgi:hypothetical protein